jgi:hypothetical protein
MEPWIEHPPSRGHWSTAPSLTEAADIGYSEGLLPPAGLVLARSPPSHYQRSLIAWLGIPLVLLGMVALNAHFRLPDSSMCAVRL